MSRTMSLKRSDDRDVDEVVIKFPANEFYEISFYLGNLRNV